MRVRPLSTWVFATAMVTLIVLGGCAEEEPERPAVDLLLPMGDLEIGDVAGVAVDIGVTHGFSAHVADLHSTASANQGRPAVDVTLFLGEAVAGTVSTVNQGGKIRVLLYASSIRGVGMMESMQYAFEVGYQ